MTTRFQRKEDALTSSKWWIVDATGVPVGRLASEIASLIRGKHKVTFTPNIDGGDFVIVTNAEKATFTGNKGAQKMVRRHTGYLGGVKEIPAGELLQKNPRDIISSAVKGMLPEGVLGHRMWKKLKVYAGGEHPHLAQMPETYAVKSVQNR